MSNNSDKAQDAASPSMEDILNSIRGVVDGEEDLPEAESDEDLPEEQDAEEDPEDDDILLLDTPAFEEDDMVDSTEKDTTTESQEDISMSQEHLLTSLFEEESEDNTITASETSESSDGLDKDDSKTEQPSPNIQAEHHDEDEDIVASLLKAQESQSEQAASHTVAENTLLSDTAAEASSGALKQLMRSIPKHKHESPTLRADMTLEELVVEAIRPHLGEWLNENLPDIVKQLVQKEIRKLLPDEE